MKPKNTTRFQIWIHALVGIPITLMAVSVAWVFFRMDTLSAAFVFFQRMFSSNPLPDLTTLWWIKILSPIVLLLIIDVPQALSHNPLFLWQLRFPWRVAICTLFLLAIFILGSQTHAPFIYAGF